MVIKRVIFLPVLVLTIMLSEPLVSARKALHRDKIQQVRCIIDKNMVKSSQLSSVFFYRLVMNYKEKLSRQIQQLHQSDLLDPSEKKKLVSLLKLVFARTRLSIVDTRCSSKDKKTVTK
jgi:hypothetical protein